MAIARTEPPWKRDPSEVDRGLSSHARIERLVAEAATTDGWAPEAIGPGDPPFDLLLSRAESNLDVVVEVKSTTAVNEESFGSPSDKFFGTAECYGRQVVGSKR
jgi:hypothetical protein